MTNIENRRDELVMALDARILTDYEAEFAKKLRFYDKKDLRALTTRQRLLLDACVRKWERHYAEHEAEYKAEYEAKVKLEAEQSVVAE